MWTDIFWPLAVVTFEVLVFALVIYLTHTFTRSHDREWAAREPEAAAAPLSATAVESVGAPPPMVVARKRGAPGTTPEPKREPEQAPQGREPVGAA